MENYNLIASKKLFLAENGYSPAEIEQVIAAELAKDVPFTESFVLRNKRTVA